MRRSVTLQRRGSRNARTQTVILRVLPRKAVIIRHEFQQRDALRGEFPSVEDLAIRADVPHELADEGVVQQ